MNTLFLSSSWKVVVQELSLLKKNKTTDNGITSVWGCRTATAGFTLIELLVVVLIIGILAAAALPQYQKAVFKSQFTEAFNNLRTMKMALEVCEMANGRSDGSWNTLCTDVDNWDISIGKKDAFFETKDFYYKVERGGVTGDPDIAVTATSKKWDVCLCLYDDGHFSTGEGSGDSCFTDNYPNFDVAKTLNIVADGCSCC